MSGNAWLHTLAWRVAARLTAAAADLTTINTKLYLQVCPQVKCACDVECH